MLLNSNHKANKRRMNRDVWDVRWRESPTGNKRENLGKETMEKKVERESQRYANSQGEKLFKSH